MSHKPAPGEPPAYPAFGSKLGAIVAAERQLAKQVNLNSETANSAHKPPASKKKPKKKKAAAPKGARLSAQSLLHGPVQEYIRQLDDPRSIGHGKVPFNPMGVPTNASFTYRSYNSIGIGISTNTASELGFFPGHSRAVVNDPLDLVSSHSYTQQLGGVTNYVIGPCSDGTRNPAIGYVNSGLTLDTFVTQTNGASCVALVPAETAPFTASDANGNHTRWRLQSLEVVLENTTALSSASGDVVYVQPDNASADAAVGAYLKYSSFRRVNGVTAIRIKWLPRTRDLYWWHSAHTTGDTSPAELGIRIMLNNSSANTQYYRLNWIANWEVSGAQYAQLSTPTHDSAQASLVIPRALNAARNSSGTTSPVAAHAEVEAAGVHGPAALGQLNARLRSMGSSAIRSVEDHAKSVFGMALGAAGAAAAKVFG